MKKLTFSVAGKRFDIELEKEFGEYVKKELDANSIQFDRNNETIVLLKAYIKSLKKSYDTEKQIESLLMRFI